MECKTIGRWQQITRAYTYHDGKGTVAEAPALFVRSQLQFSSRELGIQTNLTVSKHLRLMSEMFSLHIK